MSKYRLIILSNENKNDHLPWILACEKYHDLVDYLIVDLTRDNWLDEILSKQCDILLAKPGGLTAHFKQLYDERIFILGNILGYRIFPSPLEIFLYENKRFLSYWLKANSIPNPLTRIFYYKSEAVKYLETVVYPIVAKVNIGASGSGVTILTDKQQATDYLNETFKGKGAPQRSGPNFSKGRIIRRGFHYFRYPADIPKKLDVYKTKRSNLQKGFVLFQEYIPHDFEWRVVRIGDSFFAHKKLKINEKASGSTIKKYDNPPQSIFSFVKELTDRHHFYSQSVDLFDFEGKYLVNEMQCIFGQSDPYQMLVDGKPGRYRFLKGEWIFEEGDFAANACYNLRLEYVINTFNKEFG